MNFVTITITTSGNCKQFNLLHKLDVVREQAIINWVECIRYRDRGQGRGVRYSWGVLVASSTTSGTAVEYAKHVEWNREATDSEFHSLIEVFDVRRAERLKCGCLDCIPPPYIYIYINSKSYQQENSKGDQRVFQHLLPLEYIWNRCFLKVFQARARWDDFKKHMGHACCM